jgi:hypothetical protein
MCSEPSFLFPPTCIGIIFENRVTPEATFLFLVHHLLLRYLKKQSALSDQLHDIFEIIQSIQTTAMVPFQYHLNRLLSHKFPNLRHATKNATMFLHELVFSGRRRMLSDV